MTTTIRILLSFAFLLLGATMSGGEEARPNFILIMADDLGYGDLGCYGHETIKTPNLDRLAKEGLRFTEFHSNGAVCSPTRAALLTGRYQQRAGVQGVITAANHRKTGMALSEQTFAETLKEQGYATGMFGKWHLGYPAAFNPVKQGFDTFEGFVSGNVDYHSHVDQAMFRDWWQQDELKDRPGYITDLINDRGAQFVRANKDKPFCLYLAHGAPHYPYQGRKDAAFRAAGEKRTREAVPDLSRRYTEMIEAMDEGIGRVVGAVKEAGIEKRTLVVFMSDNGAAGKVLGEGRIGSVGPLRGAKGSLWEGGIRVPCIAWWPGRVPPGRETDEVCLSMDWFPTMASLAGCAVSDRPFDGVDLSEVLEKQSALPPRDLFWSTSRMMAMRRGALKLVVQGKESSLFDLGDDIAESKDLAGERKSEVRDLRAALAAWKSEVWEPSSAVSR